MKAFPRESPSRKRITAMTLLVAALLAAPPGCAKKPKEQKAAPPPEHLYQMAIEKMAKGHYYTARTLLQQILPRIPPEDKDLLPRVQLAIADSYFNDKGALNFGEALNGYRNFLTYFPNHEKADHAQFMVGMSLFRQVLAPDRDQAQTLKAIAEFRKVETGYPGSPYVEQARRQIDLCLDLLADHERLIGWFYQRRKVWPAAVDRYTAILDKYPNYHHMNRVLFDLGRCNLNLGNRLSGEAYFGQLWHNDPDGTLSAKARGILEQYDRDQEERRRKESGG